MADVSEYIIKIDLKGDANTGLGKLSGTVKKVSGDFEKAGASVAKAEGRFGALGAKLRSPELKSGLMQGVGLSGGLIGFQLLSTGISKVVDIAGDAISAASDLAESQSKVKVVFEDSARAVFDWADTAAAAMGLSEQAALEASSTLGNLLLSMGKTSSEAADMSRTMVQLASDISSFNNVDIQEVLMAMRSGLTGEIAPLRRFGVNLTEAALKAKALQLGLSRGNAVLDASAKSAAAYALILEQTTTAQGDFARTADGLANSSRTLDARLEDLSAQMGEALLPVMTDAVALFSGFAASMSGPKGVAKAAFDMAAGMRAVRLETDAAVESIGDLELKKAQDSITELKLGLFGPVEGTSGVNVIEWIERLGGAKLLTRLDTSAQSLAAVASEVEAAGGSFEEFQLRVASLSGNLGQMGLVGALSRAEVASRRATAEVAQATGTVTGYSTAMGGARLATKLTGRAADKAAARLRELAHSADIGKDSFKDFANETDAARKQIRWFIRDPGKLRREINDIQGDLRWLEQRRTELTKDGIQKRDTLALEAIRREEERLRGRIASLRAIGTAQGNALEQGLEAGFQPTLKMPPIIGGVIRSGGPGHTGNTGEHHRGGTLYPGQYGTMGERGPERVANVGGITTITPMGGRDILAGAMRPMVVSVRTVMSAYQSNREIQRTVNTRRMASNAL